MASMTISFYAPSLSRTVDLCALVPVDGMNMPAEQKPLRALYLLHGLYGSEHDWFNYTQVMLWARQHDLAVFCPAGENAFYVDTPSGGTDYLRFLGEDLIQFTRRLFPLSHRREDTFIGGLSMGGFGALNAGFTYPEVFGRVMAFSAALRPWLRMGDPARDAVHRPAYRDSLFAAAPSRWDTLTLAKACGARCPALWLSCGTEDSLLSENELFVSGLREAGIPAVFTTAPGGHAWPFWNSAVCAALDWACGDEAEQ